MTRLTDSTSGEAGPAIGEAASDASFLPQESGGRKREVFTSPHQLLGLITLPKNIGGKNISSRKKEALIFLHKLHRFTRDFQRLITSSFQKWTRKFFCGQDSFCADCNPKS